MKILLTLLVVLSIPLVVSSADQPARYLADAPALHFGGTGAKAVVDTVVLMGPGGLYPFRGDFETASPRPAGDAC